MTGKSRGCIVAPSCFCISLFVCFATFLSLIASVMQLGEALVFTMTMTEKFDSHSKPCPKIK